MLRPEYPIRTRRLLLRPLHPDDVDAVYAYQSRPDVCRYVPFSPRSRGEVAARLASETVRSFLDAEGQALLLAVVVEETGRLVGDVMLAWTSRAHRTGTIGYVINPEHHRRGYASEAALALLRVGFEEFGLHRIIAQLDVRNAASAGVLRRIGMRQEAHLIENEWNKGEWTDEFQFAMLEHEWRDSPFR